MRMSKPRPASAGTWTVEADLDGGALRLAARPVAPRGSRAALALALELARDELALLLGGASEFRDFEAARRAYAEARGEVNRLAARKVGGARMDQARRVLAQARAARDDCQAGAELARMAGRQVAQAVRERLRGRQAELLRELGKVAAPQLAGLLDVLRGLAWVSDHTAADRLAAALLDE